MSMPVEMSQWEIGVVVRVRRTNVLLDGMAAFQKAGGAIKDKMVVKYINAFGDQESGAFTSMFMHPFAHLFVCSFVCLHISF